MRNLLAALATARVLASVAAAGALLVASAHAQDNDAANEQLSLPPTEVQAAGANGKPIVYYLPRAEIIPGQEELWGIHLGGHVSGSWSYNFKPQPDTDINVARLFDVHPEELQMDQAVLYAARGIVPDWQSWDVGFKVEGMYGTDARFIHSNGLFDQYRLVRNPAGGAGAEAIDEINGGPEYQPDIPQAYADVAIPIGNGARVRFGKVAAPVGLESIDPTVTPFYSRGLFLTLALPQTLTGIWADYRLTDQWRIGVGVNRGFNQSLEDNNAATSWSAAAQYAPVDRKLEFALNIISGPDAPNNSRDWRHTVDATVVYRMEGGATIGGEFLWGRQANSTPTHDGEWWGVGGNLIVPVNRYIDLLGRGEYLDSSNQGLLGIDWVFELTGGMAIHPFPGDRLGEGLTIRPEFRYDQTSVPVFPGDHGPKITQMTFAIEAVYAF